MKTRPQASALLLAGVLLLAGTKPAARVVPVQLDPLAGTTNFEQLVPLLERGELSLVESRPSGRLQQVTVIGLVVAPPVVVWQVLTDYRNYTSIFKNLAELEIVKSEGNDTWLDYELEVPGSNLEYRLRHHHLPRKRIDITLANDEGDIQTGAWRWDLVPHDNGRQTILVYTLYTDVRESSWLIRQVLKSSPTVEHGLNVATGLVTIRAVKQEAERRAGAR